MSDRSVDFAPADFEPKIYSALFVVQVLVVASVSLVLQVVLAACAIQAPWMVRSAMPVTGTRVLGIPSTNVVFPGNSAICEGELWVSVTTGVQQFRGIPQSRGTSSRLYVFDLNTGLSRDTGLTLTPCPLGLIMFDDTLWAVSESTVFSIRNNQVVPRKPRRMLNEPTRPFVYENQLAVIDKNRNDVYSLLTWNEGEWTEVAKVAIPNSVASSPWLKSELRVIAGQDSIYLFFFDGQTQMVSYREGIPMVSDSDPVSALSPENQAIVDDVIAAALSPNPPRYAVPRQTAISKLEPGWKTTPIANSWGSTWDLAIVNGELVAFSMTTGNSNNVIQQFKLKNGAWMPVLPNTSLPVSSFTVSGGRSGHFVGSDLVLRSIEVSKGIQTREVDLHDTEQKRVMVVFLTMLVPYLISASLLILATSWLMSRHRKPDYVYGKRSVNHASILRRGIARFIDTTITVFPPAFWFMIAVINEESFRTQYQIIGLTSSMTILLFSIFGTWLGGIVVLSWMEGIWGITPGKWLCGIRTLRTTLRPCGMTRSFTRQFLIYLDSLFLMVWLPGVILIALTRNWQRAGDLAADTVVVNDWRN